MFTPIQLHFRLQEITRQIGCSDHIPVIFIAEAFGVTCEMALRNIRVLRDLCFLEYDEHKEKVRLTTTGKFANLREIICSQETFAC